ncbi:MAG: 23S rRNA pseudouridine(1911/1915/1917) synthase RluD [Xanthomonadales bacterium]|nr:23S rRNA pseudouridine(1911/1915/1917) synthase RluD [Xanthomonadales bacterium]
MRHSWTVDPTHADQRVDQAAASVWPDYSRSRLAGWIRAGDLRVDGRIVKPNYRLVAGQVMDLDAVLERHDSNPEPQAMRLAILFEDADLLIIDKPAGLVVHPGSGNTEGTLVNGLLHFDPELAALPRAGLVHRLDKDTSGCLVVARTARAHTYLVQALKRRDIQRHYQALVWGRVTAGGHVDAPLGRHPVDRRRQVVRDDGRRAVTHYRVNRHLAGATLLDLKLETGRTHQIRVHMQHAGFPLVGDPMYGRRGSPSGLTEVQRAAWRAFPRQALHAARLVLEHPVSGTEVDVVSPLPDDMAGLIEILEPVRDEAS